MYADKLSEVLDKKKKSKDLNNIFEEEDDDGEISLWPVHCVLRTVIITN